MTGLELSQDNETTGLELSQDNETTSIWMPQARRMAVLATRGASSRWRRSTYLANLVPSWLENREIALLG